MNDELQELRNQIDAIDAKLIAVLGERFAVTTKVGVLKRNSNLPAADPSREARQMERIKQLATEAGVDPELAQKLMRQIIDQVVKNNQAAISGEN